ncbi:TolC family protein [Erythrobacter westpacificensis]|uniref:TolC family protein n=2 Tax=Erythrobacter westpacificensis TaxID=1055231 RepID=A0ABP9K4Z5_9SPHN
MDGGQIGNLDPQLTIEQPLWAGGRITGSIDRAEASRSVAIAQLEETAQEIALQVINAYFDYVRAARRESILRDSLAEHLRLVESMERRVEQEVSPQSDLELASSRASQVQQQLSVTTAQTYSSLQRLSELTGREIVGPLAVPEYAPSLHHPTTDDMVVQALSCDPRRRRLTAEIDIAEAERKIANASILPQLNLQFSHDDVFGSRFGLVLTAQTNGGLSGFAQAEAARLRRESSELQVNVAERELRELVLLDVVENVTSSATIDSSAAAALSSATVTESFVRQFITGRRTWLDVMNAVRESTSAQITLVDAETTAMVSTARLLLRTCKWRPELMDNNDD